MVHMSHDHDTRQAGHFKNMYCITTLKSMCLSIRGPVMWNKLHSDLKGHCIELKYYADGIHYGLTSPC